MPTVHRRYQPVGPVLVRASTYPHDGSTPPNLPGPAATGRQGLAWLAEQWSRAELSEAVTMASPSLAARVHQLLRADAEPAAVAVRRAVLATASYRLRWQRRATPFGLFAGVTTATVGPAVVRIGDEHLAVARADADWLAQVVDRLEQHHGLRRALMVVANSGGFVRDGRFIVAARPQPGEPTPGPVRETSTRHTRAVRLALAYAVQPVRFDELAARLAAELPQIDRARIDTMLHGLVDGHVLITNLRPPMTAADGLAHVIETLPLAAGGTEPEAVALAGELREIHTELARHNALTSQKEQAAVRPALVDAMTAVAPGSGHPLAVDVRLDAEVRIPQRVLDEAARAARVLTRLSTQPFGSAAWLDYHTRFRTRYGPGALVPVRDLVADSGLGYPTGYLGAPRARPAWRTITERDAHLLALVQRAALDGAEEIDLSEADIEALTVGDQSTAVPPTRIELAVALHAASTNALDRGDFDLRIIGAPRAHTSMAGRFAYLLDAPDRQRLAGTYTAADDAVAVQLSYPPRRVHNENVVRVGRLTAEVVYLSEHPDGQVLGIKDLGVTADPDQLYLVQLSTGRRVIPHIPHALDTTVQTPPLARFIAEVADARSAVFGPLDLGAAARTLPYTPRVRYRRTVLAPARWLLSTDDLPSTSTAGASGRDDPWEQAMHGWRQRWRVPARVIVCHGELRLPLDLDQPLDRALLRTRLTRAGRLELREDGPADGHGWFGRPAELLIPMTLHAPPPRPLPVTAPPGPTLRPGNSAVVHARLVGNPARFDHLLASHIPALCDSLTDLGVDRWWVRRHRDTIRLDADQHLSLFLQLASPAAYGPVAARLAEFTARLHEQGLPAELTFAPYHQHPARYGHGPVMAVAEQVFAADTTAAINQLRLADQAKIPTQSLAAASMAHLAAGFATDPPTGYRALLACLHQQTEPADRMLSDLARALADPTGGFRNLRTLPGGDAVAASWQARHTALHAYHTALTPQRDPASVLRTLLHEHHVRAVGVDPEFERKTGHLARAAAMRCLARTDAR
ncbi:lantibiotic dehydratase [Micromonospora sp. NPDC049523]|uniref:lantibiotic dehydratase n=1 Tax=Micromonospora sp. NPDC049523 TaxID=3155921 RepID=UPI00342A11B5